MNMSAKSEKKVRRVRRKVYEGRQPSFWNITDVKYRVFDDQEDPEAAVLCDVTYDQDLATIKYAFSDETPSEVYFRRECKGTIVVNTATKTVISHTLSNPHDDGYSPTFATMFSRLFDDIPADFQSPIPTIHHSNKIVRIIF